MAAIATPVFPRLMVTIDPHGGGVTDEGVPYETFDIDRPATATRMPTRLASITVYADDSIQPIVWDRYTGDARPGDLRAIQAVRDTLRRDWPHARSNSYRYTVV